jgi:hypothetical protein
VLRSLPLRARPQDGCKPEDVRIDREFALGAGFADIRAEALGQAPYFVEVKFGSSSELLRRHLRRKYSPGSIFQLRPRYAQLGSHPGFRKRTMGFC